MGTAGGAGRFETFFASARGQRLVRDIGRLAPRGEGEDLAQDVLAWAWSRWETFHNDDHVVNGCLHHAGHRAVDRARKASRRENPRRDFAEHELGMAEDPSETIERREACRPRWEAFASLPAASQTLLLAVAQGVDYDNLAHRLAVSPAAVRVRIHRARAAAKAATPPSTVGSVPALVRIRVLAERFRGWSLASRLVAPDHVVAVAAAALVAVGSLTVDGTRPPHGSHVPASASTADVTENPLGHREPLAEQINSRVAETLDRVRRRSSDAFVIAKRLCPEAAVCALGQIPPSPEEVLEIRPPFVPFGVTYGQTNGTPVCRYASRLPFTECYVKGDIDYWFDPDRATEPGYLRSFTERQTDNLTSSVVGPKK